MYQYFILEFHPTSISAALKVIKCFPIGIPNLPYSDNR